ncbi:MAG TPA: hypothetical protein P5121_39340 [Caldilineaceae bacterium]|nr:hypothetical protein [Caldilineaceae bacterium]
MSMKLDHNETKSQMNRLPQPISLEDELRAEYDLKRLRVRKVGLLRTQFGGRVLRIAFDGMEDFQYGNSE